jgi:hypothetical protein
MCKALGSILSLLVSKVNPMGQTVAGRAGDNVSDGEGFGVDVNLDCSVSMTARDSLLPGFWGLDELALERH